MFHYLLLTVLTLVTADYECICNYDSVCDVYDQPADDSDELGYLDGYQCKEKLSGLSNAKYLAIAFEHKVGYIFNTDNSCSYVCPGDPNPDDIYVLPAEIIG